MDLIERTILDAMIKPDGPYIATEHWLITLVNGPGTLEHPPTMEAVKRLVADGYLEEAWATRTVKTLRDSGSVFFGWRLVAPLTQIPQS